MTRKHPLGLFGACCLLVLWSNFRAVAALPIEPVVGRQGMVVAGHPEATAIGVEVLRQGGNAMDAAVAVSLALGVAEPYGSGLGGKLMLLYFDATAGKTFVVDAMDAAPASLDVEASRKWAVTERSSGWKSVAVPGLPAGLHLAHRRWGTREWSEVVEPAAELAERGSSVEPKTRALMAERVDRLRSDGELTRLYLRDGEVPGIGTRLPNLDLAWSLRQYAQDGAFSFYRGAISERLVASMQRGGGTINAADLAAYRVRIVEPLRVPFREFELVTSPPPSTGPAMFLPVMKVVEYGLDESVPLRESVNLAKLGRAWRVIQPRIYAEIADRDDATERFNALVDPAFIRTVRGEIEVPLAAIGLPALEDVNASTTHFVVVDRHGNVVCATQSLSLHFGAGVVAAGTGIVLNDSMSNFSYAEGESPNAVAPGQRPRSTISPTLVFEHGLPRIAIGLPGGSRIPTAMLQVLLDRLVWHRPLESAIGDVRWHLNPAWRNDGIDVWEVESGWSDGSRSALEDAGWKVEIKEEAGTGLHFGGVNAIEIDPDGTLRGYADPRRSNLAAGY